MNNIKIFENKKVRSYWDEKEEQWYFSVIDIIEVLTGSSIPKRYWSDLKKKLTKEGSQLYEEIVQLKNLHPIHVHYILTKVLHLQIEESERLQYSKNLLNGCAL
jgi:hypothetical protein